MTEEKFLYNKIENKQSDFNVWMAFPGIYSFSMSSLGFLWLCKCIDELFDVTLERISTDTARTEIMPQKVDMLGFSFSFDLDFLNIFKIMDKYKIPLRASERNEDSPFVFAGGPVLTANPEPFKDFFDFIIIGDGEFANLETVKVCRDNKGKPKDEILKLLAEIDGVYVPKIHSESKMVKSTCKLQECISTPILSERAFFKNTFIVEIARGCSNRCGFCLASYLNLPIRFVDYDLIIKTLEKGLENTNKIALLGALIAAHPRFVDICKYIRGRVENGEEIELSISSLRVDSVEPEVIKTLVACGQKHATIAIEAGSDRLRKVINKNITEEQIFNTAKIASENGLKGLKIYAMIGLPTETQNDINEMISLAKRLKKTYKGFDFSYAFSSFVPKPHTPFQWCGREDTKSLEKKQNYLKKEFHKLGIKASFSSVKWDYYQTLLSRGGSELCDYVEAVYVQGGNLGAFKSAYKEIAKKKDLPESDYYAIRKFDLDENFPWDFIQIEPGKDFLQKEFERLIS